MSDCHDLIDKLREEINRCKAAKLDSRKEYDMGTLPLASLNTRLTEYDKRIAEARTELHAALAECGPAEAPDVAPDEADGPLTSDHDETWDVFISYQRDAEAQAREIYTRLTADGFRVWQDVNNIRHTARWSQSVDGALRGSERLILLMTPQAMKSGEAFNEWFYFYNKKKPIHCLMLETCDPHYQLLPYQYIDWREATKRDWVRLMRELRADFDQPTAITPSPIVSAPSEPAPPGVAPAESSATKLSPFADLLEAARDPESRIALTADQIKQLAEHKPLDLAEYRLGRIAEWSQPRYALDNRFVNLTLLLDKGEDAQQRWQNAEEARFNDLRDVLAAVPDPAFVVLGAPGSGKSTLLRRFQMDHSIDQLRADGSQASFFIQLNGYRGDQTPHDWLSARWQDRYPDLPPLDDYLRRGQMILLLDALNEMPHRNTAEYHEKVAAWRTFTQEIVAQGNQAIYSCRTLDYSALLSSKELRVPQIEVQPMSTEQVREFITVYSPTHADIIWRDVEGTPQFDLFRTPIYLKLLLDQVERTQQVPKGKAQLFTQFVRQQITRNLDHPLLAPDGLLSERDHRRLTQDAWKTPFELPERGLLIPNLSMLAFAMQEKGLETEGALVRIDFDDACDLLDGGRDEDILKAGVALTVLDEDIAREEITFFHQLLQEFFAARQLSQEPNPALIDVKWRVDEVSPTLDEVLATLADGDPLPPLPQTGWEETTLTAAPMARDPNAFIRDLMSHNLPLAARCAASPEITLDLDLKRELQQALIARSQDFANADLRARIAAGLALGELGDPRFERKTGPHGEYLLPPMITIPAGTYPMGDDDSQYNDEKPAHTVTLDSFEIGKFPVTNAEYALFMAAGGYEDEQWWDTDEALAWLRGEGSTDGQKASWRDTRATLQSMSEQDIQNLVPDRITSEQANTFITVRNWTDERFEQQLDELFPSGQIYRQPEYWDDTRFNRPTQPVVGVTWFEARAYCNWLSANALTPGPSPEGRGEKIYTLPSEAQFEAAARGTEGRDYPYGSPFDASRSNTFESHIRRTTPIGIFDNATPEGAFDLTGNAYTWTSTLLRDYPYDPADGREATANPPDARRVLRGGSWHDAHHGARAACRSSSSPGFRYYYDGFRLCCVRARQANT